MPEAPVLEGTEDMELEEKKIAIEDLPHCSECAKTSSTDPRRGLLRPGTVFFGKHLLTVVIFPES